MDGRCASRREECIGLDGSDGCYEEGTGQHRQWMVVICDGIGRLEEKMDEDEAKER